MIKGVQVVVGIDEDGYREVLGIWCADTENETSWSDVFADLKGRGLHGVTYVVSDNHKGLRRAIARHFQGVVWQRCQVHFTRNILSRVSKKDRARVRNLLREITEARTVKTARACLQNVVEELTDSYPKVAEYLDEHGEEILAVYALPEQHRKRMRSTNMLERLNQELKRRTRVVRIFPNEAACIRLIAALAIETNEEWMARIYLKMEDHETGAISDTDEMAA